MTKKTSKFNSCPSCFRSFYKNYFSMYCEYCGSPFKKCNTCGEKEPAILNKCMKSTLKEWRIFFENYGYKTKGGSTCLILCVLSVILPANEFMYISNSAVLFVLVPISFVIPLVAAASIRKTF